MIVSASACWYDDVPIPKTEVKKTELDMAIKFIDQGIAEEFRPQEYKDKVRCRILDLMEALKASLKGGKGAAESKPAKKRKAS